LALLDEKTGNLFVGDALGIYLGGKTHLPPFMPPSWDPGAFYASLDKLKHLDYRRICLAHFGCVSGEEAGRLPETAAATYAGWWRVFEENAHKLEDVEYLMGEI